jgi:hypothetical protein
MSDDVAQTRSMDNERRWLSGLIRLSGYPWGLTRAARQAQHASWQATTISAEKMHTSSPQRRYTSTPPVQLIMGVDPWAESDEESEDRGRGGGGGGGGGAGGSEGELELAARHRRSLFWNGGRGLHSFPFQLNLSSSVHRTTQLKS